MHCPYCGKELIDNQKFCGVCGSNVSDLWQDESLAPAPVETAPVQAAEPVSEPVVMTAAPAPVEPMPVEVAPAPAAPAPVEPMPVEAVPAPAAPVQPAIAEAVPAPAPMPAPGPAPAPGPESAPAPVETQSAFGEVNAVPAAQPATPAPRKKKGLVGLIIGISAAAVLLIAGVIAAACFFVGNLSSKPTHTNGDDTKPKPTATQSVASDKTTRTIMFYAVGSNLESRGANLSADIKEMLAAQPDDSINIVLQTGGCQDFQNTYCIDGQVQRFEIKNGSLNELDNLGKISMVDTKTLEDFIKFSKANYPADDYILVLWDHGGGIPIGFGVDENYPDDTLTDVEIAEAISQCDIEFESIIFNACLMGSLEVAKAVDPYTEYIVAAESPTWGSARVDIGINYTDFLNYIGKDFKGNTSDYCKFIVKNYMEGVDQIQTTYNIHDIDTCMSAIDTDNIEEVYIAYEAFIAALDKRVFATNGYAEYIQLRDNCGAFEGSDSVDLTTLATKYLDCGDAAIESAASKLINEVSNCVYTQSNNSYTYAHGMTTYSPFKYPDYYNEGRTSFVKLGYSDSTIKFYDKFVSAELYYANALQYANKEWYVQPTDAGTRKSGEIYDISNIVKDMGGYEVIQLAKEDWDIIREVKITLACMKPDDKSTIYYFGTDNQYTIDKDGCIIIQNPTKWVYFENFGFTTCECLSYEIMGDGSWTKLLGAEALINGKTAYVLITFSSENQKGDILGYCEADIIEDTYDLNKTCQFTDSDKIIFVEEKYDVASKTMSYKELGKGKSISYMDALTAFRYSSVDYDGVDAYIGFDIYDVYNNDYKLPLRPGKPAYEIDAIRGTNNGSTGGDYDEGVIDASILVGTAMVGDSDSFLGGAGFDFTANGDVVDSGEITSPVTSIGMVIEVDTSITQPISFKFCYSEDNMFSRRELDKGVGTGTVTPVSSGDKNVYNITYDNAEGITPGYYFIYLCDDTTGTVLAKAVMRVV